MLEAAKHGEQAAWDTAQQIQVRALALQDKQRRATSSPATPSAPREQAAASNESRGTPASEFTFPEPVYATERWYRDRPVAATAPVKRRLPTGEDWGIAFLVWFFSCLALFAIEAGAGAMNSSAGKGVIVTSYTIAAVITVTTTWTRRP